MAKTFRPYLPHQSFLLPPSPMDWLPEGHLARFILEMVGELDLSGIMARYEREMRGHPPYHPQMMVALLLYAYCVGVPSSRKIERRTYEDIAFRVIAGNTHPDHCAISDFRRRHLDALVGLFTQVLQWCQLAGLVKLGHVSIDGTKLKGNASKHKAMSYKRLREEEDRLNAKVLALLNAAESADAEGDAAHGAGVRGDDLPKELLRTEERLKRIRDVKRALEDEARLGREEEAAAKRSKRESAAEADTDEAESDGADTDTASAEVETVDQLSHQEPAAAPNEAGAEGKQQDAEPSAGDLARSEPMPLNRPPSNTDGTPTDKAQRNFTDPDSRIMKTGDGYIQGYNGQAVVDSTSQIIVAHGLSNQSPDAEYFVPLLDMAVANLGQAPAVVTADNGYFSERNVSSALAHKILPYIAPGRERHGAVGFEPPKPGVNRTVKEEMRAGLSEPLGNSLYRRRKAIIEPVFGQIKNRGFRSLLLRGLAKARGEWALIALTHNLLKLHKCALR